MREAPLMRYATVDETTKADCRHDLRRRTMDDGIEAGLSL